MNRRTFLAACSTLLATVPAVADPTKPDIARLIEQLGSKRFKEREAAGRALEKLGEKALPALQRAAKSDQDAEVKRRAALLVETIDKAVSGEVYCFGGHKRYVCAVALSPSGRQGFSAGLDDTMRCWDCAKGEQTRSWDTRRLVVISLALSPDATRILAGGNANAVLWDARTGLELRRFEGHRAGFVRSVALSPDGTGGLFGGWDGTARLWDMETGKELWCISLEKNNLDSRVHCVAFSPDGKQLLACGAYEMQIRDPKGKQLYRIHKPTRSVAAVFSADGRDVVWGDDEGILHVWDLAARRERQRFRVAPYPRELKHDPHEAYRGTAVLCLALAHRRLVSGHRDGTFRMWDVASGRQVHCAARHTDLISSVSCSRDGKWALSGSYDNTVRLWRLPP